MMYPIFGSQCRACGCSEDSDKELWDVCPECFSTSVIRWTGESFNPPTGERTLIKDGKLIVKKDGVVIREVPFCVARVEKSDPT